MSARDDYPAGVPCWVDVTGPDPQAAAAFYGPLLGWAFEQRGDYLVASLDGAAVAGAAAGPPAWNTYIRVDDADAAVAAASAAGATVLAGPLDAGPPGRFAVLSDPAGAAFCVWQAGARKGAERVNDPGTWAMSSLHTQDPDGAVAFYGEVFGWSTLPFGPMILFTLPGYVGGEEAQPVPRDVIAAMAPPDPAVPTHWNVNLRVADVDALADRAAELGGSVLMAPFDTPGFRNAVIADPAGAVFSVSASA